MKRTLTLATLTLMAACTTPSPFCASVKPK
jgi:hypothetical protein